MRALPVGPKDATTISRRPTTVADLSAFREYSSDRSIKFLAVELSGAVLDVAQNPGSLRPPGESSRPAPLGRGPGQSRGRGDLSCDSRSDHRLVIGQSAVPPRHGLERHDARDLPSSKSPDERRSRSMRRDSRLASIVSSQMDQPAWEEAHQRHPFSPDGVLRRVFDVDGWARWSKRLRTSAKTCARCMPGGTGQRGREGR